MQPSIIQQYGYTWVAIPRESLMPLSLLEKTKEGFFKRLFHASTAVSTNSSIYDLFPWSGKGKRVLQKQPENVPNFNGFDVSEKQAGFSIEGLKSLEDIGSLDAASSLAQASMLLYNFKSPKLIGIHTEILLEEHLNLTSPIKNAAGYMDKLRTGKLYVVTEVLQCNEFSVEDASSFKIDGHANAEALNGHLAKIKADSNLDNKLSQLMKYKGSVSLTFAVKARQIKVHKQEGRTYYGLYEAPLRKVRGEQNQGINEIEDSSIYIE